jgi:hypothetical protein
MRIKYFWYEHKNNYLNRYLEVANNGFTDEDVHWLWFCKLFKINYLYVFLRRFAFYFEKDAGWAGDYMIGIGFIGIHLNKT